MLRIDLGKDEAEEVAKQKGPGVAIVTSGEGVLSGDGQEFEAKEGYIFYIAPGTSAGWRATSGLQVHEALVRAEFS